MGSMVLTPWPISGFWAVIVTTPARVMRMNALGAKSAAGSAPRTVVAPKGSRYVASSMPPPATAVTRRNWRRSRRAAVVIGPPAPPSRRPGEWPGECADRWRSGRDCRPSQRQYRHPWAWGAWPGALQRVRPVARQPLDGRDGSSLNRGDGGDAGPGGRAVYVDGTGAALRHPAPEFRAREVKDVAQHPEERHVGGHIHGGRLPVHLEPGLHSPRSFGSPRT